MKIIDISLPLNNKTPIYPDNVPLMVKIHHAMPEFATMLSSITLGSHTGTHVDAPAHTVLGGATLDRLPLEAFVGPCRVLDFSKDNGESIKTTQLKGKNVKSGERILLKTKNSSRGFQGFHDDYIYLDGDAADYLVGLNITAIGIDSLSIKKRKGPDHRPHVSLLKHNIPIIEGLDLSEAQEKEYELVCLPLKFTDIEGAPARAILIER